MTFVLAKGLLVTIRYDELRAFERLRRAAPQAGRGHGHRLALFGLLDAVVERLADLLEHTGEEVQEVSPAIFSRPKGGAVRGRCSPTWPAPSR